MPPKKYIPKSKGQIVEEILDRRPSKTIQGKFEYLVRWQNSEEKDSTWEPEDNLNCPTLIPRFECKYYSKKEQEEVREQKDEQRTPLEVLERHSFNGLTYFLIKFDDGFADRVPAKKANLLYTDLILKYYEDNALLEED